MSLDEIPKSRNKVLHDDALKEDLAHHDDHQLDGQLDEAPAHVALFLLEAQEGPVRPWIVRQFACERETHLFIYKFYMSQY